MQLLQTSHFCFKVMLQKSDPCCCFCKLIEVSSVYGGPGSAKTVDLTSPLIHWPEYGDRSSTAVWAPPHLSFPCCCLTGAAEGLILMDHIRFKCCHASSKYLIVWDCTPCHLRSSIDCIIALRWVPEYHVTGIVATCLMQNSRNRSYFAHLEPPDGTRGGPDQEFLSFLSYLQQKCAIIWRVSREAAPTAVAIQASYSHTLARSIDKTTDNWPRSLRFI